MYGLMWHQASGYWLPPCPSCVTLSGPPPLFARKLCTSLPLPWPFPAHA
jgi:hypothetical protein